MRPPGPVPVRAARSMPQLARDLAHVGRREDAAAGGRRRRPRGSARVRGALERVVRPAAGAARRGRASRRRRRSARRGRGRGLRSGLGASRSGARAWVERRASGSRQRPRARAVPARPARDTSSPGLPTIATGCPSFTFAPAGDQDLEQRPLVEGAKLHRRLVGLDLGEQIVDRDRVALLLVPRRRARPPPSWATASACRGSSPCVSARLASSAADEARDRRRRRGPACGMHALLELRAVRHRHVERRRRAGWARRARRTRGAARGRRSRRRRRRRASPRARRPGGASLARWRRASSSSSGRSDAEVDDLGRDPLLLERRGRLERDVRHARVRRDASRRVPGARSARLPSATTSSPSGTSPFTP